MNVKPLGDRVLVQLIEKEEAKKGGIIIPDSAKEKPQVGRVIALGTGKRDEDGKLIPFEVKKGDRVFVSKYLSNPIDLESKEYYLVPQDDILGIIEG
ncbi:MAG: co-chaperone GroES [Verrucomicrobiia bacterium]|jgi:chaperonin GroES